MAWDLRLELFVDDLDVFAGFYARVLGFTVVDDRRDSDAPYLSVRRDRVRIGAVRAGQPVDHAARGWPACTEIVLEVDDVTAERDRVVAQHWPLTDDLQDRPWGLTDFRLLDPDGYLLRLTSHSSSA